MEFAGRCAGSPRLPIIRFSAGALALRSWRAEQPVLRILRLWLAAPPQAGSLAERVPGFWRSGRAPIARLSGGGCWRIVRDGGILDETLLVLDVVLVEDADAQRGTDRA